MTIKALIHVGVLHKHSHKLIYVLVSCVDSLLHSPTSKYKDSKHDELFLFTALIEDILGGENTLWRKHTIAVMSVHFIYTFYDCSY